MTLTSRSSLKYYERQARDLSGELPNDRMLLTDYMHSVQLSGNRGHRILDFKGLHTLHITKPLGTNVQTTDQSSNRPFEFIGVIWEINALTKKHFQFPRPSSFTITLEHMEHSEHTE